MVTRRVKHLNYKYINFYKDIEAISKENRENRAKRKEEFMSRLDFVGDGSLETNNKNEDMVSKRKMIMII